MKPIEFQDDVDASNHWPRTVSAWIRIDHRCGQAELIQLRLLPCRGRGEVRVEERALNSLPRPPETIAWRELPGTTLLQRSLQVIAVHCFGSVEMPARVKGQAGWSSVGVSLLIEQSDAARDIHFEVGNDNGSVASSRWRFGRGDWMAARSVAMHRFDTDPLRALLRLAIHAPPAREACRPSIGVPSCHAASPARSIAAAQPVDAVV